MKIVQENQITEEHRTSPKGEYELIRKHISLALGGKKDKGAWGGGHPFDVELSRLPTKKKNYPLHSHAAQWEHYIILSGKGRIKDDAGEWSTIKAGDHIICPPNEAHQIENIGADDLVYYVISDHHPADITSYPNTGKKLLKPDYMIGELNETDYYEGEE